MSNERRKDHESARDLDLVNSEAALRRAARRAREQARGYVVVYRDGKIVEDRLDKRVD